MPKKKGNKSLRQAKARAALKSRTEEAHEANIGKKLKGGSVKVDLVRKHGKSTRGSGSPGDNIEFFGREHSTVEALHNRSVKRRAKAAKRKKRLTRKANKDRGGK